MTIPSPTGMAASFWMTADSMNLKSYVDHSIPKFLPKSDSSPKSIWTESAKLMEKFFPATSPLKIGIKTVLSSPSLMTSEIKCKLLASKRFLSLLKVPHFKYLNICKLY